MTVHPLTETLCPRPANGDPDGITAAECFRLGHCGCDEANRMTVHPLILAGAKALDPEAWEGDWKETHGYTGNAVQEAAQRTALRTAEAVIRSLPNGSSLLTGEAAVLPVEATADMCEWGPHIEEINRAVPPITTSQADAAWSAMVAAHLKAEKQG